MKAKLSIIMSTEYCWTLEFFFLKHSESTNLCKGRIVIQEFGVLCCLTTPGLRKDIRRQIRQLYSHKVTYYVHYNYILSSGSWSRSLSKSLVPFTTPDPSIKFHHNPFITLLWVMLPTDKPTLPKTWPPRGRLKNVWAGVWCLLFQ